MLTNCTILNVEGIVSILGLGEGKNKKKESENEHDETKELLPNKTDLIKSDQMNIQGIL